jgi:hypothetical protein
MFVRLSDHSFVVPQDRKGDESSSGITSSTKTGLSVRQSFETAVGQQRLRIERIQT